jgi:hypothetical protein
MACRLSEQQLDDLFKAVHGSVIAAKNNEQNYNAEEFMRNLYNLLLENNNGDQANALDYIQHIPKMLVLSSAMFDESKLHLKKSKVSIDNLNDLDDQFNADVTKIPELLGLVAKDIDIVKEIIKEANLDTEVIATDVYDNISEQDRSKKNKEYNDNEFLAYPNTGLAMLNQEAQNYSGVDYKQNIVDQDPKKVAYYAAVRKINDQLEKDSKATADHLDIFIRVVPAKQVAFEDLYTEEQEYFKKDDDAKNPKAKTSAQKLQERETGDDILLVFTDKNGNNLYFDKEGNTVDKENGTLAYSKARRVYKKYNGDQRYLYKVQTVEEMASKEGAPSQQEIAQSREQEMDILQGMRDYAIKNPEDKLMFSVTLGKDGYVREVFSSPNRISSLSLEGGFNPFYSTNDTGMYQKGGVYFNVPGYDMPVLIQRPKFSEISGLVDNLASILFDSQLSDQEKMNIVKQFTYSKDTDMFVQDGRIFIEQNGEIIDTLLPDSKQKFIDNLSTQIVNINKDLLSSSFINPVNLDGNVTTVVDRYNNFISDNFYTYLQPNAEGKIVKLNAYNSILPTVEAQQKMFGEVKIDNTKKETSLTEATASDNSIDELIKSLENLDFELKKSIMLDNKATLDQINKAEQWFGNSPLSKYVSLDVLFNVVNSDARATFTKSGITLYSGANFTDLYHESFHAFSQMFLTKGDKQRLYNEVRKLTGSFKTADGRVISFKNAMDIQLEEFLAEDFREYVLSDGTKIINGRSTRNSIFRKIYNFLKALFNGQSIKNIIADQEAVGAIKELYDQLYIGDINQYKPTIDNVQFTSLNKGVESLDTKDKETLTYQDSTTLVETIDSLLASNLSAINFTIGNIFVRPEALNYFYEKIKKDLAKIKDTTEDPNVVKIIDFALNNWGDYNLVAKKQQTTGVIAFHKSRSSYLTFDERFADLSVVEKEDELGENTPEKNEDDVLVKSEAQLAEEFGVNVFERKGNEKSAYELASNETVYLIKSLPLVDKNGKVVVNSFGVAKPNDYTRTWGITINTVQGAVNKTDMYKRLVEASTNYPELKELVNRLGDPIKNLDTPHYHMWTKFYRDFSMYKIPIKELQIIAENENGASTGEFVVRFVESDPLNLQVQRNFTDAFQGAKPSKYVSVGKDGRNKLNTQKVFEDFPTVDSATDKPYDFLRAIGFYMTDSSAVRKELYKNTDAINFIYKGLQAIKGTEINNPILSLEKESGRIKQVLKVEAIHSGKYSNNSISNVSGDNEYDISLNNTTTQVLKELNDQSKNFVDIVKQPHMAHLNPERNPGAKYSTILGSMFVLPTKHRSFEAGNVFQRKKEKSSTKNQTNVNINISNLNGIKSIISNVIGGQEFSDSGIKTASLDINSKFLMDLHTMLETGSMELTRRASKQSAFGINVTKIDTDYNQNARHLYISTGHFANDAAAHNMVVALLKGKIASELERIAIVKSNVLPKIAGFTENGSKFMMFDDILDTKLQEDLIASADPNDSFTLLNDPKFAQRISDSVKKYMDALYLENKQIYEEMPVKSQELLRNTRRLVKSDTGIQNLNETQLIDTALKSFTFNALYHNMEMVALIDGDLAMYNHNKEEYHKRNARVTSTGRIFSTDISDLEYINKLGRAYANKIGAESRAFDGTLNSAIFADNVVSSKVFNEYLDVFAKKYGREKAEKILSPYKEMNEGDAQGWITFDAYRILGVLEGNWSPDQNALYNKIVNGETVEPKDVVKFFPPRKLQYAGALKTEKLDVQAFHKFSVAPLIPSVVKGTNMETLHDNLVKQGFDYAIFNSGSKMATITNDGSFDKLYTEGDNRTIKPWTKGDATYAKNTVFMQYLKNQVDINDTWKNKTIFSTQLRKLIINDMFSKGVPLNNILNGLVNDYEGLLNTYQEQKKADLLEEIGWSLDSKNNPTGNIESLVKFVKKELSRQDMADHEVDFIDLDINGKLKRDLSFSLNAEKIEKLLNAIVVKRLVRQKVSGEQLVQVSGAGFESQFRNATENELDTYGTNDLPTYRPGKGKNGKTSAAKVKIALKGDYYNLLNLKHTDGKFIGTRERLNEVIKDDKWLDKDDNRKMITMVGVRIPVQGFNSMEFMEVYEFLPEEAGNIIIPPAEIVAKSGSDFDIDKLTVFQPNFSAKDGNVKYIKGKNTKGSENKLIESIRSILEHPDNFEALVRPNDTDLVKGVANDLAKEYIQGYNHLAHKVNTATGKISPTRVLEPRYNLYKHESNNIGKKTLGIGAVDNTYSALFKKAGIYLEQLYTRKTAKGKFEAPVRILMKHNTVSVKGTERISLSDIYTTTNDKISDLISQLMNGWVDIEKDAWIFNINGNNVAGPVLLFLLEAGVDFRNAAYFVSQPLIIDYVKYMSQTKSPFFEMSGGNKYKDYAKYNHRVDFINKYIEKVPSKKMADGTYRYNFSTAKLYDMINNYTGKAKFDTNSLFNVIKSKDKTSDQSKAALLHFIELENLMGNLTNLKLTVNVDTSPSKSFFSAQERRLKIAELENLDLINQDLKDNILYNSVISSFYTQEFQLNIWKPLMQVRSDESVNNFLLDKISAGDYTNTFDDAEKFTAAFKNDIPLYLMQNYFKGVDLDNIKTYNSLLISKPVNVAEAQIKYGAFVKDGVLYVDKDQIRKDFNTKAYTTEAYDNLGLAKVDNLAFNIGDNNQQLQEYAHFVLEREYLRSLIPVSKNESREVYETKIKDRALERTFNFYTILKSKNNIADEFQQLKASYPELSNYAIFDQLVSSKDKTEAGFKTLKLKSERMETALVNTLHENLVRLSDPSTVKVADSAANDKISKFFNRLIIAEYLRAGISKTSDSLAKILPTENLMRLLEEPLKNLNDKPLNNKILDNYYSTFKTNWSKNRKSTRSKFRNYLATSTNNAIETEDITVTRDNTNIYDGAKPASSIKEMLENNPDYVFVYATNENGINESSTEAYVKASNTIGIPVKSKGGSMSWTDETYDNNVKLINQALDRIQDKVDSGESVVFPMELTLERTKDRSKDVIKDSAPRTNDYLVTELYKRFKYVNFGANENLGFRYNYQLSQPISDVEIDQTLTDLFKNCNS